MGYRKEPSLLPPGGAQFLGGDEWGELGLVPRHMALQPLKGWPSATAKGTSPARSEGAHEELSPECKQRLSEPHLLGPQWPRKQLTPLSLLPHPKHQSIRGPRPSHTTFPLLWGLRAFPTPRPQHTRKGALGSCDERASLWGDSRSCGHNRPGSGAAQTRA